MRIAMVSEHATSRSRAVSNGYARVRQRYTWSRVADGLLEAYTDALLGAPVRARQAVWG